MRDMTTPADTSSPPAGGETAERDWNEAFGDLDLDNDVCHSTTFHSQPSPASTAPTANSDKLNIVHPLWFLRTDEAAATEQFARDHKTRVREILNFRVDQSVVHFNMACWLYAAGRYQQAIDVITAQHQLSGQSAAFNSKEQQLVYLDLLARCHHKLANLPAALSFQQQIVSLRASISNLLLLARMMAESADHTSSAEHTTQLQARAAVLMRCIELCPVHAAAWHELSLVFLALSSSSHSSPCCSRLSFLWSARLSFSVVADLTNFTLSPHSHPAGDVPTLSTPLYSTLLVSAQQHIAQLDTQLPESGIGADRGNCTRCAGVCDCWRQRLHRFACLPLASLFTAEKAAEQAGVEGSKRTAKRRGKSKEADEDDSEDETSGDVDQFDALNM